MNDTKQIIGILAVIGVVVAALIGVGTAMTKNVGMTESQISEENASANLNSILKNVKIKEKTPTKANVEFNSNNLIASLPDIDTKYPLTVKGNGDIDIEIFSSTEKAGTELDGWLNRAAENFNKEHHKTPEGKTMSVSVRKIASGAAVDYIVSGAYLPDGYTPSNELLGELTKTKGGKLTLKTDTLVKNTAGIAITKQAKSSIESQYGTADVHTITQAVLDGNLQFGYTYPYTSATGLNYLITALETFDENNILSDAAVKNLQTLQANIPFVCYTTDQMTNAMASGTLQAGVVEYQSYRNDSTLSRSYEFIPFGYEHNNPLYSVGTLTSDKNTVMDEFTEYLLSASVQQDASACGFNQNDYTSSHKMVTGTQIMSAQDIWKKEKNATAPIAAVFIADVSGSMNTNNAIGKLKDALSSASQNINSTNYIGMLSYSDNVTIELPIAEFDLNQRSYFAGAVRSLSADGNTATYDAVAKAVDMLNQFKTDHPNIKPVIFLLSDGEQNIGCKYSSIAPILQAFAIPVYSISYNNSLAEMENISKINEAVHIQADTDDVIYTLTALFNAQM